ncbi:cell surface protein [Methanosarcina barkeri str. Wiesmoor]|uniref:Cell surface protein n=2 Tax=Methanosarcina barkeri TaxID=2208 RepID=A0A0E3QN44_METBA|nr:PKD domain-containing protein [Methanosarcina barkeri]AKB51198.1 cell surface protein [Methanosarcina barkeri str. Wiesmoor]
MKKIFLILCIVALMCMTGLVSAAVVTDAPVANFTANPTSGTAPLTVQFTDISTNATSWAWDFNNDGTVDSTEQNPVYTYTAADNYTVNLTVANAGEKSDSEVKTDYIVVNESLPKSLVANFTANVTTGTSPLTVEFIDISTGSPTSWQWDFNDDGIIDSTKQNQIYTYSKAGNYTVNLTVSNADGNDSEVKIEYIIVSESLSGAPVADFAATPTSGDAPLTVNFTDASNGTVSSYSWDFDNDGTVDSTEQNPSYTYTSAGKYTVNLTITNATGSDSKVKTNYVTVEGTGTGGLADTAWPKFHRDLNNTGQSPYNGPQTNTTIWNYTTGSINYASPVIGSDGTIYIGSYGNSKLYAINPDGTLKWTYNTGGKISGSAAIGTDGTIYIGSYDKNIYAINPDGTLKWAYNTGGSISGSAVIGSDGTIYIGSSDDKVYAINPDGTLKWTYTTGKTISGSLAIGKDGTIYIGSYDKYLHALNPNGTLKWKYKTWQFYHGSPSIGTDGTIYTGSSGSSNLYALNPDGTLKWRYSTGDIYGGTPAIATDGTIYIGSYSRSQIYALNPDGTLKWTYNAGAIFGSMALGADGTIYIGSSDKKVYAINPDGTLKWSYTTGGTIYGSPVISADGTLYIGSYDGKLYAFKDVGPVANFTATYVPGAPLTIQFNDTSSYNPTSWAWDFGDNETSTEQNPVHTYAKAGNYTVTLTAANDYGSDAETKTERFETLVATSITVSPVSAQLYLNKTQQFSATAIDQFGKNMSDVSFTWLSSNESVGTINTSGLLTSLAPGTTNVTASSGNVSAFAQVTVIGPSPDLNISSVTSTTYPISYNKITATIRNEGTEDAGAFKTNFTVDGNTTSIEIPGLDVGNTTTISITDMVRRKSGDSIPIMVMVDPENSVAEANETNNLYTTNATITASGDLWQGGRFSVGHDLVNNAVYEEGNSGVAIALSGAYTSSSSATGITFTRTFSAEDMKIPAGATIKSARIYQGWTWYGDPGFNMQFNGRESQKPDVKYIDSINGQAVFDVTPYFNATGNNTAVIASTTTSQVDFAYYGTLLVVVYEAPSEPYRQIWVNEGSDCLLYSMGTGYTMFENVTTDGLFSAKITTVLESGDGTDGSSITFNDRSLSNTGSGGADPLLRYFNVSDALRDGENELGVAGNSYFNLANAILEVTKVTASEANFTANTTNGNAPLNVKFTDTSTGTPTNWTWDFGDGKTSTEQNPTHIYKSEGNYTVKLTVSNSLGSDSEEKNGYITVGSVVLAPEANFSADQTSGNAPLTVQFKDKSTNTPTLWEWDFGDGKTSIEQNPSHTYETVGTYTVNLTAMNYGGSNTTTKTDYITVTSDTSAPVASFTTDSNSGQVPFTVKFTDTSTGKVSSWNWDFGDGSTSIKQNPTHTYVTEGSYNVTLTATGPGGSNTATSAKPIIVSTPLTSPSYNGGIPLTTAQNGTVSGGLWYDSYPGFSTSAQKTFTLPDYTKVKWARLYVDVYDGHMENNYRGNVNIDIDANGDSKYEIQKNETFDTTYSFPGEGGIGPVWLSDHMNRVTSDYLMWYDLTDVITGQQVNVQATTTKIDSSFDGRVKAMMLVVAYDDGDSDQVYYWVNQGHDTVNPLDETYTGSTSFGTSSLASGWSSANLTAIYLASKDGGYTFNGTTLDSGVASGSYYGANTWDISSLLGAGQDSALTYNKQDSSYYKIPLALMSVKYTSASPELLTADFKADVTSGNAPLTVNFTDQSTGSPTSWFWDFGDGTNATEQNPIHTYISAGNYTVNLTVANADGNDSEVKTEYIIVSELLPGAPVANFTANKTSGKAPLDVQFTDASTGNISSYAWDFDNDGTIDSNEQSPLYTYASAGTYTVNLTVANANGNDSEVKTGYIKVSSQSSSKPVAEFSASPTSGKTPLKVKFTDTSTGSPTFWFWKFGDGSKSFHQNPVHKYSKAGTYTVNLTVKNAKGKNTVTKTQYIKVITKPAANFNSSVTSGKTPLKVKFTDTSTGIPAKWRWDFGDGSKSFLQNPVHKYSKAGTYTVNLTVKNAKGKNTVTKTEYIKVITKPVANFTSSVTSGKTPLKVKFTDTSTGIPAKWRWDFGDGAKSFHQNPVHKYSKAGTYTVNLTVKNAKGKNTVTKTQYIKVI